MESWRAVFRRGIAPLLSVRHLEVLRDALRFNDPSLLQGSTTMPPPISAVTDWPVEAACAIGYCAWKGDDLVTVAEVGEFFARACFDADQRLNEPGGIRWWMNWYDETPRPEMIAALLPEVERALAKKQEGAVVHAS